MISIHKTMRVSLALVCGLSTTSVLAGPYDSYMNANCPQLWQELAGQWSDSVNDDSEDTVPEAMELFINDNGEPTEAPPWAQHLDSMINMGMSQSAYESKIQADKDAAQANINAQPYTLDTPPIMIDGVEQEIDELPQKLNDQLTVASNCLAYINMVVDSELAPVVTPPVASAAGSQYGWLPAIFN